MTDRAALIAKIEAATEPDRELDVDISVAFGAPPVVFWTSPQFSKSIDAALTLVKPGMRWALSMRDGSAAFAIASPGGVEWVEVEHPLAPLAIVLAALRMTEGES